MYFNLDTNPRGSGAQKAQTDRNINLNFKLDALPKPTIRRLRGLLSPRFSTSIDTAVISDAQAVRLIRPTEPVTRVGRTSEAESSGSRPRISGRLVSNVQNKGRTVFGISKRDRSDNATSRSRPTRTPPEDTDEINSDPINKDAAPNRMFRLRSRLNLATNVTKLTQHEEGPPMLFSDLARIETQNMLYIYSCFAELASLKFPGRTIFDNLEYLMEEGRALAKYRDALEGSELLNIIDSEANQETGTTNGVRAFFIKHTKPSGLKEIVVAFHTPRYSTSNKLWKKTVKYRGKKDKDTKNRTKVLQGLIPGNLAKEKDKGNINGEKTEKKESAGHIDKVYWSWYLSIAKFALRELMASIEIMKERGTPPCDITVTGYKDAAALAILFMADIHSVKNNLLRLAVFSTPRFGDAAFSEYYNKLFPRYNGVSNRYFEYSAIIPEDNLNGLTNYKKGCRRPLNKSTLCLYQGRYYYVLKDYAENPGIKFSPRAKEKRINSDILHTALELTSLPPHRKKGEKKWFISARDPKKTLEHLKFNIEDAKKN